jgi:hypothetical protein
MGFERLCGLINKANPANYLSPVDVSALACLLTLALAAFAGLPILSLLDLAWAQPLVFTLLPLGVTFVVLHHSCWHQEMVRTPRTLMVSLYSILILGGVMIAAAAALVLGAMAYMTFFQGFRAIHY